MEEEKNISITEEKVTLSFIDNKYYIEFCVNKSWLEKIKNEFNLSNKKIYNLANIDKDSGIEIEVNICLPKLNEDGKVTLYFDDEIAYTKFWVNCEWYIKQAKEYQNWSAEEFWYKSINDIKNSDMDFEVLEWH